MFGIQIDNSLQDMKLSSEKDCINFAKIVAMKLDKVSLKSNVVKFFKELMD